MSKFLGEAGLDALIDGTKDMISTHANDGRIHMPVLSKPDQVLIINSQGTPQWVDQSSLLGGDNAYFLDTLSYGISWVPGQKDPKVERIGNSLLHKTQPILSKFKGCIAQGNTIQYYLNPTDWSTKEDGTPSRLDGYDGNVDIDTGADFFIKSYMSSSLCWVRVSEHRIDETWTRVPRSLVHAYRSTMLNTVPENMGWLSTLQQGSMISVCNTAEYCRGGGNRTAFDAYLETNPFRSDLGKPRTVISRANARIAIRKTGDELLSYEEYKNIFCWLWAIEYASFYMQDTYTDELTVDGYKQGGMGPGATWDSTSWSNFNNYYPVIPCGYTNSIGNGTGIKALTIPATDTTTETTFNTFRWHGFECDWDIWTNLDGFLMDTPVNSESDVLPRALIFTDPAKYTDSLEGAEPDRIIIGCRNSGWISEFNLGENAEIVPSMVGGAPTQGKTDYYWVNYDETPETLLVGAHLDLGSSCGFFAFDVHAHVSHTWNTVGFRGVRKNPVTNLPTNLPT